MKNIKFLVAIAFGVVLSFTSCIKPITDEGPKDKPPKNINCMVDGVAWAGYANATIDPLSGLFKLVSTNDTNTNSTLNFQLSATKPSVYALGVNGVNIAEFSRDKTFAGLGYTTGTTSDAIGTVTVTALNTKAKTVSGVFSFLATQPGNNAEANVTEGVFTNVPYTGDLPSKNRVLYAKIDGRDWNGYDVTFEANTAEWTMTASDDHGKAITFILPPDFGPGSYPLSAYGQSIAKYEISGNPIRCNTGTITIDTRNYTKVSGSFHFDAGGYIISSGTFDADF